MSMQPNDRNIPASSSLVAWGEFLDLTGAVEVQVRELVDLGWLEPAGQTEHSILFRQVDVYKTRKLTRICADFDISSLAGTIIVDLLQRIDQLESRLREAERRTL